MPRKEHRSTPVVIGPLLYTSHTAIPLDSPAWFDWLDLHLTFYFDSPLGCFTARHELRRACSFWYAFRRSRTRLYKAYLGRPSDLSAQRLLAVAEQLALKAAV